MNKYSKADKLSETKLYENGGIIYFTTTSLLHQIICLCKENSFRYNKIASVEKVLVFWKGILNEVFISYFFLHLGS